MKTFIEIVRNCMLESIEDDKKTLREMVQEIMDLIDKYPSGIDLLNDIFK